MWVMAVAASVSVIKRLSGKCLGKDIWVRSVQRAWELTRAGKSAQDPMNWLFHSLIDYLR